MRSADRVAVVGVGEVDEQDAELVTAASNGRVGQPDLLANASAHGPDDVVTRDVAVLVVDLA